jgi:hypothetical protein
MTSRIDFEAVNGLGVTVATFGDLKLARRFAREHAAKHAGLHIVRVERVEFRSTVYRPRVVSPRPEQGDA